MRVAELPAAERPREKLIGQGAASLSDAELLAVLLRTGTRGASVLEFAQRWLGECGGLTELSRLDVRELLRRPGVGPAKATLLAAALELGCRLAREALGDRPLLDRPELVAEYLLRRHADERVEVFGALTLDARHRLLREYALHRGGRTHSDVEPGEVFHEAILDNANALVLWHTHPSGDPSPSADDVELTRRLVEAGRLLNVSVLDHIVVARAGWVSLRQRGAATFA